MRSLREAGRGPGVGRGRRKGPGCAAATQRYSLPAVDRSPTRSSTKPYRTELHRSYPIKGATESGFSVNGITQAAKVTGLKPDSYYVFTVIAQNGQGNSDQPAVVFHRTPAQGEGVPGPPSGVTGAVAGDGVISIGWTAPSGSTPDYYMLK